MRWVSVMVWVVFFSGCDDDTKKEAAHCLNEGITCPENYTCKSHTNGKGACFYTGNSPSTVAEDTGGVALTAGTQTTPLAGISAPIGGQANQGGVLVGGQIQGGAVNTDGGMMGGVSSGGGSTPGRTEGGGADSQSGGENAGGLNMVGQNADSGGMVATGGQVGGEAINGGQPNAGGQ